MLHYFIHGTHFCKGLIQTVTAICVRYVKLNSNSMAAGNIIPLYTRKQIQVSLPIQKQEFILYTKSPVQVHICLQDFKQGLRIIWQISCAYDIAIPNEYQLMCGIGISNCKIIRHGTYALSTLSTKPKGTDISKSEIKVYAVKKQLLCEFTIKIFKTAKNQIECDQTIYPIEPDYHEEFLHVSVHDRIHLLHHKKNWLFNRYLFHHWMCKFKILLS